MSVNELGSMEPLARRLVACRGFRWIAGMRARDGENYQIRIRGSGEGDIRRGRGKGLIADYTDAATTISLPPGHYWLPDLPDPATAGLLPTLAREALGCPTAHAVADADCAGVVTWWIARVRGSFTEALHVGGEWVAPSGVPLVTGATETEAWIVAMESAK